MEEGTEVGEDKTKLKKPLYKKWWFWAIVVIVFLGVINSGGNKKDVNKEVSAKPAAAVTQQPTATKAPEVLSNEGTSSDVKIVVEGVESKPSVGDNQFSKKDAQGVFKVVKVTLTNNQKDAITIDSNSFKLMDDKGREFSYSAEAQMALVTSLNTKESFFLSQLNPGLSLSGYIVFDVPKDATRLYMKAKGGMLGKEIKLRVE